MSLREQFRKALNLPPNLGDLKQAMAMEETDPNWRQGVQDILLRGLKATDEELATQMNNFDWLRLSLAARPIKDELSDDDILLFYKAALTDAIADRDAEARDRFIDIGVNLEYQDMTRECTALQLGARLGDTEGAERLMQAGASLETGANVAMENGLIRVTPVLDAIGTGHINTARALLRQGAKLDPQGVAQVLNLVKKKKKASQTKMLASPNSYSLGFSGATLQTDMHRADYEAGLQKGPKIAGDMMKMIQEERPETALQIRELAAASPPDPEPEMKAHATWKPPTLS